MTVVSHFTGRYVTRGPFTVGIKPSRDSQQNATAPGALLSRVGESPVAGWFVAAMAYAVFCSLLALQQSFSAPFVVQDDARQHVTWFLRFTDPGLFPNDLLADYFQSLAPAGYRALYRLLAWLHLDAITASKLLPGVLAVISGAYCFGLCRQMARAPQAAFFATVILMQSLWMNKDLSSATPRAFLYPLFVAFLYYAARRSRPGAAVTILLQGLFYPPIVLVSAGALVLSFFRIEARRLRVAREPRELVTLALVLAIAGCTLALYSFTSARYGPLISLERAQGLADFHHGGRIPIFGNGAWYNWVKGTGGIHFPTRPYLLWFGLLIPFMGRRSPFSAVQPWQAAVGLLPRVALVSLALFVAARLCLFHLYLPSRYTQHTARIVLSLAAGIALSGLLEWLLGWAKQHGPAGRIFLWAGALAAAVLFGGVLGYPAFLRTFPMPGYMVGRNEALYTFLAQQPKETMIASLAEEANNLPSFARRSTLVGREFAAPFHVKYYDAFQQRVSDLLEAQYTEDPVALRRFIERYHVSWFLLERQAYKPGYLRRNNLARTFTAQTEEVAKARAAGARPILAAHMREGVAFANGNLILIDASAILRTQAGDAPR